MSLLFNKSDVIVRSSIGTSMMVMAMVTTFVMDSDNGMEPKLIILVLLL